MAFDLKSLLERYIDDSRPPENVSEHFDQVAHNAPPEMVKEGISEAFRSDQTPPFGQMISQLFGNANPNEKSGILSNLLGGMGPAALGSAAAAQLAGIFNQGDVPQSISPEQAEQISPEQVQQIATQAEQNDPSIIDKASAFYARNPGLVKTLGGAALAIALAKMAQGSR